MTTDGQMQCGLIERYRFMPPPSWDVQHISSAQKAVPEWRVRRIDGRFDIATKRILASPSIDFPVLPSCDLKNEDVVIIPMAIEALRCLPTGICVDLHVTLKGAREIFGQCSEGFHEAHQRHPKTEKP